MNIIPSLTESSLSAAKITTFAALLSASQDISLIIDTKGKIIDIALGSEELQQEVGDKWKNKNWVDIVSLDSQKRVKEIIKETKNSDTPIWQEITHILANGSELPIRFCNIALDQSGKVIALGRDLRAIAVLQQQLLNAQQSLEQDYWRLRQLETRYRLIFDMAADAVLVIDEPTNKVLEANPVAKKLLASDTNRIIGKSFPIGFEKSSTENVSSLLAETRVTGKSSASNLRLSISDRDYKISISLLRQDSESRFLVRLYQTHGQITSSDGPLSRLIEITNNAPDGVVITNTEGHIQYANKAFLNLAQLASEEHALNQSMDRWLGRTGVDLNILITNLRNYNSVKLYASKVRGEHGTIANVEISACMVDEIDPTLFVIFIRDIERRVSENITKSVQVPRSVNEITSQVGKLPLKEIVRESSDMIEKGCIKTALELTDDNRASAAEILGLSRQSLYAKLKTHNIGDLNTPTE